MRGSSSGVILGRLQHPPQSELINKTIKLVELIYPVTLPNTRARMLADAMEVLIDVSPKVLARSSVTTDTMGEMGIMKVDDNDPTLGQRNVDKVKQRQLGPSATLEKRRDYGQYLLSGRGKLLHDHMVVCLDLPDSEDEFSYDEEYD